MQFCKNEGYLSPLLLVIGLFIHKGSRSRLLVDVLHYAWFSISYLEVLKLEKYAVLSNVKFDNFVNGSGLEPDNRFGNS